MGGKLKCSDRTASNIIGAAMRTVLLKNAHGNSNFILMDMWMFCLIAQSETRQAKTMLMLVL